MKYALIGCGRIGRFFSHGSNREEQTICGLHELWEEMEDQKKTVRSVNQG